MISAPLRTPHLNESKPTVKTHGHLALLEWDQTQTSAIPIAAQPAGSPIRKSKSTMDRCYEGGTVVLFAATVAALAVRLCRF